MFMPGKNEIIERMRTVGNTLGEHHDVVAVGGTALTLHGLKDQTRDVDFIIERDDLLKFTDAYKSLYADQTIHLAERGTCFAIYMPNDYMAYAYNVDTFGNVALFVLGILDNIITKASRYNQRDQIDLEKCKHVDRTALLKRVSDYSLDIDILNNVKTALIETFGMPREDIHDL